MMEKQKKPIYKISSSLINSWLYYESVKDKEEDAFQKVVDRLRNEYKGNYFTDMGEEFEAQVYAGVQGILSDVVKDLPHQIWGVKWIELGDFRIRVAGCVDAIDAENNIIYDIKRVAKFDENKYEDSVQHLFYFWLFPEVEEVIYLLGVGPFNSNNSSGLEYKVIKYKRPDNIEELVLNYILLYYEFLVKNNLMEVYKEFQKFGNKRPEDKQKEEEV